MTITCLSLLSVLSLHHELLFSSSTFQLLPSSQHFFLPHPSKSVFLQNSLDESTMSEHTAYNFYFLFCITFTQFICSLLVLKLQRICFFFLSNLLVHILISNYIHLGLIFSLRPCFNSITRVLWVKTLQTSKKIDITTFNQTNTLPCQNASQMSLIYAVNILNVRGFKNFGKT